MNRFINQHTLLCTLGASLLLGFSGCQDEDFGYTKQDIMDSVYARRFTEVFGDVDPNHTWNTASQTAITVDINFEGLYTVKVYTANPRYSENNVYLVGQFDGIEPGTHTFQCDMPATVECAYVGLIDQDGNRMILPAPLTANKAKVSFGNRETTRTVYTGTTPFIFEAADVHEWTLNDLKTPLQTLPEGVNNTGKVAQNFEYVSMGEFTLYPIYSITSNRGEYGGEFGEKLGIYTYGNWGDVVTNEDGTPKVTPIWRMNPDEGSGSWYEAHNKNTGEWCKMMWFCEVHNLSTNENNTVWDNNTSTMRPSYDKIQSAGIKLNIPPGTRFGFALLTDHGYIYSNSLYNKDEGGIGPNNLTPDHVRDTYAATFHEGGNLYLAFEDWGYGSWGHDTDFNDLVLRLLPSGGYNPLIIDKDIDNNPMLYIVACEDLGGTFDWDFNDVVFGIEHVSGQTNARIKLLAAGGTLPVSLKFYHNGSENDITFGTSNITDLHTAFSAETNQPVNVNAVEGVDRAAIYSNAFTVDANTFNIHDDAKNFRICVTYADGTSQKEIHLPDYADKAKAPQAFLISDPTWKWPNELQNITDKYKDFAGWATDLKNANNWTHTSWGQVREESAIPSNAFNILTQFPLAVDYKNKTATFALSKDQFGEGKTYKLVLMVTEAATSTITDGDGNTFPTLPDGSLTPNRYITFTFNPEVGKAIRESGKDGNLIITFENNVVQNDGKLKALYWYEAGAKPNPNLAVTSEHSVTMKVGTTKQIQYVTDNQESAVQFSSSDNNVIEVDANTGLMTAKATGNVTISVTQRGSEHYSAAGQINVSVLVLDDCHLTVNSQSLNLWTFDDEGAKSAKITYTTSNNASAVLFTSSNESIVTVDNQGNVTPHASGSTTIKVYQGASQYYAEDQVEVTVKVNFRDGYGWRTEMHNAENRTGGRSDEVWKYINVGDQGGIKQLLGWNVSGGVKIIFDYTSIFGINDFFIQSRKESGVWTKQLKEGENWIDCTMSGDRKLTVTISEQDFNNNFQASDNTWLSNLFFGGWSLAPRAVYVDHP